MIKKGADIGILVSRHLTSWREGKIDILIDEFERCVKRYSKSSPSKWMKLMLSKFSINVERTGASSCLLGDREVIRQCRSPGSLQCGTK